MLQPRRPVTLVLAPSLVRTATAGVVRTAAFVALFVVLVAMLAPIG